MRRLFDVMAACVGMVATLPILAVIALAVYLDTGAPVLFAQIRVGRDARAFRIWKFRSMVRGAQGSAVTAAGDPRITRVGRFLRDTKLDELPQLWNVLRGDMALVGPRPELPGFVEQFPGQYGILLRVRPGLVDPASLAYADEEQRLAGHSEAASLYVEEILPAKLRLSARYLDARTAGSDARLILETVVLAGKRLFRV